MYKWSYQVISLIFLPIHNILQNTYCLNAMHVTFIYCIAYCYIHVLWNKKSVLQLLFVHTLEISSFSSFYAECNTGKVSANLRPLIYNRPSTAREGSKLTIIIATDVLISTRLVKPWHVCYHMLSKLWVLHKSGDLGISERINYGILTFLLRFIYLPAWFFSILLVKWLNPSSNNM